MRRWLFDFHVLPNGLLFMPPAGSPVARAKIDGQDVRAALV
ncbi:hypothetical protein [Carbonactinospora thermoautotrophica]|nr:hypothetical protein [Carbonactinospora thermoautotrophica]